MNNLTNFTAGPGSSYGTIRLRWDIPTAYWHGGYKYWHPQIRQEFVESGDAWIDVINAANGWQSGAFYDEEGIANMSAHPNFDMSLMDMDNFVDDGYQLDQSLYGQPHPAWARGNPYSGFSSSEPGIWWDMYGQGGDLGSAPWWIQELNPAPCFVARTADLPDYQNHNGVMNTFDSGTGVGGMCYFVEPITNPLDFIVPVDETMDAWASIQEDLMDGGTVGYGDYTLVSGMSYTLDQSGTINWKYDWHNEHQDIQWGNLTDKYYYNLGVGPYNGAFYANKFFSPDYGGKIQIPVNHNFNKGGFYVFGREGYNMDDSLLGTPDGGALGGSVPSHEQIDKFIDPEFDPGNYFHKYVEPSLSDIEEGYVQKDYSIAPGNWNFVVFYSDGHTTYLETPAGDSNWNDTFIFPDGMGPETQLSGIKPNGPMGSLPLENIYSGAGKGFTYTGVTEEQWQDAASLNHGLNEQRQYTYWFRSENDLNIEKRMNWPFLEDDTTPNPYQCQVNANHWPLINGLKYNDLGEMEYHRWEEGSGYATGIPNSDPADFHLDFPVLPYVYQKWDKSYVHELEEMRIGASFEEIILDSWMQGDQSTQLGPNQLLHLLAVQSGLEMQNVMNNSWALSGYLQNMYGWTQNYYGSSGYGTYGGMGSPVILENNGAFEPSGAEKPELYYLRLDNEIVFTLGHMNVPDDFCVRIINMNLSGDFSGTVPENDLDYEEAPVFWDFMRDVEGANTYLFETAPWWDFTGGTTLTHQGHTGQLTDDDWYYGNYNMMARDYLRIRIPWDTSVEPNSGSDSATQWKIIWGSVNTSNPINDSAGVCDEYGGAYGMRILDPTFYANESDYSSYGNQDQVMFHIQNTPPIVTPQHIPAVLGEAAGTRNLVVDVTHPIPVRFESVEGIWNDNHQWQLFNGDSATINTITWDYAGQCGVRLNYTDLIALGYVWDPAGNISMGYRYWDFQLDNGPCPEDIESSVQGNQHYPISFGEERKYLDWIELGAGMNNFIPVDCSSPIQDPPGGMAYVGGYYMFSSNAAAARFIGIGGGNFSDVSSFQIAQAGYITLEMIYNDLGIGSKEMMRTLSEIEGTGVDPHLAFESQLQGWWQYDNISMAPFTAYNLPTNEEVAEWDGEELTVLPGTGPPNGPAFYGRPEDGYPQPIIYCDPFLKDVVLKATVGCMSWGKFMPFPIGILPEWLDHSGNTDTFQHTPFGQVRCVLFRDPEYLSAMSASSSVTPYGEGSAEYCDVSPGFEWGEGGGEGFLPDVEQTHPIMYWYNPMYKRWDTQEIESQPDTINIVRGNKTDLYTHTDKAGILDGKYPLYLENSETAGIERYIWTSKKLNMTMASQMKMYYKVRLVRKNKGIDMNDFQVSARTDHHPEFLILPGMSNEITSNLKIPRKLRKGRWIQIKLESLTNTDKIYISSVSIIWRRKTVK